MADDHSANDGHGGHVVVQDDGSEQRCNTVAEVNAVVELSAPDPNAELTKDDKQAIRTAIKKK